MQVVLTSPSFHGKDVSTTEMAETLFDSIELSELHASCRRDCHALKTEVNRLTERLNIATQKAKAESPVKISIDENESLKRRVLDLENEVIAGHEELVRNERKWRKEAEDWREKVFDAEKKRDEIAAEEEAKWKHKLDEVLKEMKKQRERTMSLLRTKEAEVEAARNDAVEIAAFAREKTPSSRQGSISRSNRSRHNSFVSDDRRASSVEPFFGADVAAGIGPTPEMVVEEEERLSDEEERFPVTLGSRGDEYHSNALHVACREALSHVQADLKRARVLKADVEAAYRKLQNGVAINEENQKLETARLKAEIDRLSANERRTSQLGREQNLEYLKNVVYKLIISKDSASKLQLIPVVATILQFSSDEKKKALAKYQSWWSGGSGGSSSSSAVAAAADLSASSFSLGIDDGE